MCVFARKREVVQISEWKLERERGPVIRLALDCERAAGRRRERESEFSLRWPLAAMNIEIAFGSPLQ